MYIAITGSKNNKDVYIYRSFRIFTIVMYYSQYISIYGICQLYN